MDREKVYDLLNDKERLTEIVNRHVNETDIVDRTVSNVLNEENPHDILASSEAMAYGRDARIAVAGIPMKDRRALQKKTKASLARQMEERLRDSVQTINIYASKKWRYKRKTEEELNSFSEVEIKIDDRTNLFIYYYHGVGKKNKLVNRLLNTDVSGDLFIAKEIDGSLVDILTEDIDNFHSFFQ